MQQAIVRPASVLGPLPEDYVSPHMAHRLGHVEGATDSVASAQSNGRRSVPGSMPIGATNNADANVNAETDTDTVDNAYSAVFNWVYLRPRLFPLSTDCSAWLAGLMAGAVLSLAFGWTVALTELAIVAAVAMLSQAALGLRTGIYRYRWRISSFQEVSTLGLTWMSTSSILVLGNFIFRQSVSDLPTSSVIGGSIIALAAMTFSRAVWRRYWEQQRRPKPQACLRTIVLGAGEGGEQIVKAMLSDPDAAYYPAALLDDDPTLANREIGGVRVEGSRADIERVAGKHGAEVLLIAIPSADPALIREISALAQRAQLTVRVLPATSELTTDVFEVDLTRPTSDDPAANAAAAELASMARIA